MHTMSKFLWIRTGCQIWHLILIIRYITQKIYEIQQNFLIYILIG